MIETDGIQIKIGAKADEYNKTIDDVLSGLNQLGSSTKNVSGSIADALSSMSSKAGIAGLAITAAFGILTLGISNISRKVTNAINIIKRAVGLAVSVFWDLTKQVVSAGAEFTRLKLATDTIAKNVGMTTEEVEKLRDALADSNTYGIQAEEVIKTLAMSGLVDMAKGLSTVDARTGETVEGVTALVLAMKDLAAASGYDSATGIERLTRFIRRGEAGLADGIIEIGFINKSYQEYAKTLGKTVSQLTEAETAFVRMNIVMQEATKAFGVYATVNQSYSKAVQSSNNALKSIIAMIGDYFAPVLNVLGNSLYQFIYGIREFFKANAEAIKSFAIKVAGYALAIVRVIGSLLSRIPIIGKYFRGLANMTVKTTSVFGGLSSGVADTGSSMADTTEQAKKLNVELLGLASFDEMNVLNRPDSGTGGAGGAGGGDIGGGLGDIGGEAGIIGNEIANQINAQASKIEFEILKRLSKVREWYNTYIKPFVDTMVLGVRFLWTSILKPFLDWIGGEFKKFSDNLKYLGIDVEDVIGFFVIFTSVTSTLGVILGLLFSPLGMIVLGLGLVVGAVILGITIFNKFIEDLKKVKENLAILSGVITEFVNKAIGQLVDRFRPQIEQIANWFRTAKDNITATFNSIVNFINDKINQMRNTIYNMGNSFGGLGASIANGFKGAINWLISKINDLVGRLNSWSLPKPIRALMGGGFNLGYIQSLAKGGIVDGPTNAIIGESGREAVMPLENNTGWITDLAKMINERGGGGAINLTVKIGDDKIYDKVVDYLNDKTMLSNTNLLRI